MPRIPDQDSLGQRPTPRFQRGVVSVRNRGSVAEAAGQFGATINQVAGQALEKQDKFNYAAAKASLLKADVEARTELQDDPDYGTFEARYNERMGKAKAAAGKLIQSNSDRGMFEADAGVDVARGLGQVKEAAHGKMVVAEKATLKQGLFDTQDIAANALDEPTRAAAIGTGWDMIDGAMTKGIVDPVVAGDLRRGFSQDIAVQRGLAMIGREDWIAARAHLEASRTVLDRDSESQLENAIRKGEEGREAIVGVADLIGGADSDPPVVAGKGVTVPSEPDKPRVLKPGESARVNKANLPSTVVGFLTGRGYSEAQSRGIAAGIHAESGARADAVNPSSGAFGIGQWLGSRKAELFARYGSKPSMAQQLEFLDWELKGGDHGGKHVRAASTETGALDAYIKRFMRPKAGAETNGDIARGMTALGRKGEIPVGGEAGDVTHVPDLGTVWSKIDVRAAEEGWSPEKKARWRSAAAKQLGEMKAVENDSRDAAFERAAAKAETLGAGFTDVSQLGPDYEQAAPEKRSTFRNWAESNATAAAKAARGETIPANGDAVRSLHRMAVVAPEDFANAKLATYRSSMTPAEFDELSTAQAKAKEESGQWTPRAGVQEAITWGEKFGGVKINNDSSRYRVYRYMEDRARQFRTEKKGGLPNETDFQRWFGEATAEVKTTSWSGTRAARGGDVINEAYRKQIVRNFKATNGREPNEDEIASWFDRMSEPVGKVQ